MLSLSTILLRRLRPARLSLLTLAIASCAPLPPTAAVTIPPVPAGAARVWFYRDGGPYVDGTGTPYLRMNGTIVGLSQPEGALYRDVAPGQYHVTVDSYGKDFNQSRDVYLFPGQQVYFKIVSLRDWIQGGGGRNSSGYERNTFYVWEIPPEVAQADVARSQFYGGG
jgi:hypothetical protein